MRMRIILVLAFFALMFAGSVATAYLLLSTSYTSSIAGLFFKVDDGPVIVTAVPPEAKQLSAATAIAMIR